MTANEYQAACMRTASGVSVATRDNLMLQGVMGMCGEAGEAVDVVKKMLFQGHELDKEHLAIELGDVLWYVATTATALDMTLEEVMQKNIDKLSARYPEGFDADKSQHRSADDM